MWMWRRFIKEPVLASFLQIKTKHTSLKSNKVTDSAADLMAGTVIGVKQAAGGAGPFHVSSSRHPTHPHPTTTPPLFLIRALEHQCLFTASSHPGRLFTQVGTLKGQNRAFNVRRRSCRHLEQVNQVGGDGGGGRGGRGKRSPGTERQGSGSLAALAPSFARFGRSFGRVPFHAQQERLSSPRSDTALDALEPPARG